MIGKGKYFFMRKIEVKIYSKGDCCLCDVVKKVVKKVQRNLSFELIEVDITTDKKLLEEYESEIPVVFINDRKAFKYRVNEVEFKKKLEWYQKNN